MTTYLGKSCSFGLPWVPFVNCRHFMYLVISLLVLMAGCGIWLYQFLIIAYLFTLTTEVKLFIYRSSTGLDLAGWGNSGSCVPSPFPPPVSLQVTISNRLFCFVCVFCFVVLFFPLLFLSFPLSRATKLRSRAKQIKFYCQIGYSNLRALMCLVIITNCCAELAKTKIL